MKIPNIRTGQFLLDHIPNMYADKGSSLTDITAAKKIFRAELTDENFGLGVVAEILAHFYSQNAPLHEGKIVYTNQRISRELS